MKEGMDLVALGTVADIVRVTSSPKLCRLAAPLGVMVTISRMPLSRASVRATRFW